MSVAKAGFTESMAFAPEGHYMMDAIQPAVARTPLVAEERRDHRCLCGGDGGLFLAAGAFEDIAQ